MDDFLPDQLAEPVHDLVHDLEGLLLLELFALDQLFQVSIFAVLRDYVQGVFGTEHVLELDDVGVVEPFQEINL